MTPSSQPLGLVTKATPTRIFFQVNPALPSTFLLGSTLQAIPQGPPQLTNPIFQGKVDTVSPKEASFPITYTKIPAIWPAETPLPEPGTPVYRPKHTHRPNRTNPSRANNCSNPALPVNRAVPTPPVFTCVNCRQTLKHMSHHPDLPIRFTTESITCRNCSSIATITLPPPDHHPYLPGKHLTCAKSRHPLRTLFNPESGEFLYGCLYCATRRARRRTPPFLLIPPTDQILTTAVVNTAIRNVDTLLTIEDTHLSLKENQYLINFLLAYINQRKQEILAFSEKPPFTYPNIRTRIDPLLDYQHRLEAAHIMLTSYAPDPEGYPPSTDRDGQHLLYSNVVNTVSLSHNHLKITYKTPFLTASSPTDPSTTELVPLYEIM